MEGKTVSKVEIKDESIFITFECGYKVMIFTDIYGKPHIERMQGGNDGE